MEVELPRRFELLGKEYFRSLPIQVFLEVRCLVVMRRLAACNRSVEGDEGSRREGSSGVMFRAHNVYLILVLYCLAFLSQLVAWLDLEDHASSELCRYLHHERGFLCLGG